MGRVAKPMIKAYTCSKCSAGPFLDPWRWRRHRDTCGDGAKTKPLESIVPNPNLRPLIVVESHITGTGNTANIHTTNTVVNINIVTHPTPVTVHPLGSREEVERGLHLPNEDWLEILKDPIHLAQARYLKHTQCGGDVRFSNIRVDNVSQDVVLIKQEDDEVPEKRAGRGAYFEVGVLLHEVLRQILPAKLELQGENEATDEVLDQVED